MLGIRHRWPKTAKVSAGTSPPSEGMSVSRQPEILSQCSCSQAAVDGCDRCYSQYGLRVREHPAPAHVTAAGSPDNSSTIMLTSTAPSERIVRAAGCSHSHSFARCHWKAPRCHLVFSAIGAAEVAERTLFMTLMASLQLLLHKITQQTDVCVGS